MVFSNVGESYSSNTTNNTVSTLEHQTGTIKITTRQTVQYHGVIKKDLIETINSMNRACLDTVAACGDVNRNVMCSVARSSCEDDELYETIRQVANSISEHLIPEGLARKWCSTLTQSTHSYHLHDQ